MVESKKKSPLGIIITIILMILCFAGGYFLHESGVFKVDKNETVEGENKDADNDDIKVTEYDVTDAKVAKLVDHLLSLGIMESSCWAIENYAKDVKVEAKDVSNLSIYHIVESAEFYNKKDSFTLDEMNAAIKKYFYGDIKFDPTTIDYKGASCPQYNYDSSTKTFTKQQTACGSTCGPASTYKMVKAVDTDGTLKVDVKVVFAKDAENFYSDYKRTNLIGTFDGTNLDELLNKGGNYQFTFKNVDGSYAYVSSEPVK